MWPSILPCRYEQPPVRDLRVHTSLRRSRVPAMPHGPFGSTGGEGVNPNPTGTITAEEAVCVLWAAWVATLEAWLHG